MYDWDASKYTESNHYGANPVIDIVFCKSQISDSSIQIFYEESDGNR